MRYLAPGRQADCRGIPIRPIVKDGVIVGGVISFSDITGVDFLHCGTTWRTASWADLRVPLTSLNVGLQQLRASALPAQKGGFDQALRDVGQLLAKTDDLQRMDPSRPPGASGRS